MTLKNYPRIYCPNCKTIIGNASDKETRNACDPVILDQEQALSMRIENALFLTCPKCKKTVVIRNNLKPVSIPVQKIGVGATSSSKG